jgi:hypothetical protein
MSQKYALPLFGDLAARAQMELAKPTIEQARQRLGGTADPDLICSPAVGEIVDFDTKDGRASGVVIYADASVVRVMLDAVRVRHLRAGGSTPHAGDAPDDLRKLSTDARIFASLAARQPVHFHDGAGMQRGTLVEKCVYGALVAKDDGKIIAVGFRKLWPLPETSHD